MHSYSLSFFSLDSATVNVAGIIEQYKSGEQWDWHQSSNPTLQVNAGHTIHIAQISDLSDTLLQDDPKVGQQTLAQDILDETGAILWSAGSTIEDEYEIELSDPGGTTYRFVAIGIDDIVVGFVFEGTAAPLGTVLSYCAGKWHDLHGLDPAIAVACFSADALIATARGDKPAGQIKPGDMVLTRDAGFQPVRWVGLRPVPTQELAFAPHLRPIRIAAGALGPGVPRCDLKVSPQHRILVRSRIAAQMFGENEILVAAKHLTSLPGVDVDTEARRVTYVHLLFDRHQIVFANGAPSESLYIGAEALRGLDPAAAAELRNLMPHLPQDDTPQPARYLTPGQRGRKLAERLVKNGKHLFDRNAG